MNETLAEIKDQIRLRIQSGFDTPQKTFDDIEHDYGDSPQWNPKQAEILIKGNFIAHEVKQSEWEHTTDCDKLDEAFAELDRYGIIARHNFTCCQTCGHRDMEAITDDIMAERYVQGYVFYHWQDTESAIRSNYLYLAFSSYADDAQQSQTIGEMIIRVLGRHGLEVSWEREPNKRICITNINWQRRRTPITFLTS